MKLNNQGGHFVGDGAPNKIPAYLESLEAWNKDSQAFLSSKEEDWTPH